MTELIRYRQHKEKVSYALEFHWNDWIHDAGSGFSFDCDEDGNVNKAMPHEALENYEACVSGKYDVICDGVEEYVHRWTEPAAVRCGCGEEVELHGFTNTCEKCGADYNMCGDMLAPREQWGEETGETVADIMRPLTAYEEEHGVDY